MVLIAIWNVATGAIAQTVGADRLPDPLPDGHATIELTADQARDVRAGKVFVIVDGALSPSPDQALNDLRGERDRRLCWLEGNGYMFDDRPLPDGWTRPMILDLRQALRDLPENSEDPFNPVWPDMPA